MMGFSFFNRNKNLQIAQLLLIFVDILPKVGAVHFTEFSTSNDVVVVLLKILIISQLLCKTCNIILSAPRSWMQVCAIHKLRKSWSTVCKLWIAQACLHDIGADKMRLQVLMRSWEMMSILNSITTTSLLVEKLSKMNCTHFLQNINKKKWEVAQFGDTYK